MIKIGLTGNIASGKTQVEEILATLGVYVVDLDKVTHSLFLKEEIQQKLKEKFNTFERKEISKIVFSDFSKKQELEKVFHPELKKNILNIFKEKENEQIIVISGALIYEAGFDKLFDKIIFVDADKNLRIERLKKRSNLTHKEALKRINSQNLTYKNQADYIIENNNSLNELKNKVEEVLKKISWQK